MKLPNADELLDATELFTAELDVAARLDTVELAVALVVCDELLELDGSGFFTPEPPPLLPQANKLAINKNEDMRVIVFAALTTTWVITTSLSRAVKTR